MWTRLAARRVRQLWKLFPAVLILGARQVGKTTLARQVFPRLPYCDLEEPATRALFAADPRFQLEERGRRGLILDEAQTVPAVFSALRGLIDAQRERRGRFLLLGSAQPTLLRSIEVWSACPPNAVSSSLCRRRRSWENLGATTLAQARAVFAERSRR